VTQVDSALKAMLGAGAATTTAFLFVTTILYAPVTEESAKLTLMLFPWIRRRNDGKSAIQIGMAIGLGFGVGEMWQAAYWLSKDPDIASTPWYLLGGFMIERLLVCFNHVALTTAALRRIRQAPVRSVLFAVGLHV